MRIPLNITGGGYKSRSLPLSAQTTHNFYPELQDDPFAKDGFVLQPYPGYLSFGSDSGADRGMLEHKGVLYKVSGISLHSVDNLGAHTSLGTIEGSGQCILTGFGDNVLIASKQGKVYQYNGATVAENTDADLETPDWVANVNNTAVYGGNNGRFAVSPVGDAINVSGLDYATAEVDADNLIRGYSFQQKVYFFGDKTTEIWQFSGKGRPPVDPIPGAAKTIGIAGRTAVASNDSFLYFLSDERKVFAVSQGQFKPVSTIGLSHEFESYGTGDDANAFCYTIEGQNFFHIAFPTEDKSWDYSESTGMWFETPRSDSKGRGVSNSYAFAYGKPLVADYRDSNIYQLDVDTFTENGAAITRQRDSGPIHSGLLGSPGSEVEFTRFELLLERGTGILTGQGSDPIIMLQISTDGGKTFGTEMWERIGKMAKFHHKVVWTGLGRFESAIIRIKTSDPVLYSIHSAAMELELVI